MKAGTIRKAQIQKMNRWAHVAFIKLQYCFHPSILLPILWAPPDPLRTTSHLQRNTWMGSTSMHYSLTVHLPFHQPPSIWPIIQHFTIFLLMRHPLDLVWVTSAQLLPTFSDEQQMMDIKYPYLLAAIILHYQALSFYLILFKYGQKCRYRITHTTCQMKSLRLGQLWLNQIQKSGLLGSLTLSLLIWILTSSGHRVD